MKINHRTSDEFRREIKQKGFHNYDGIMSYNGDVETLLESLVAALEAAEKELAHFKDVFQ